VNYDLFTPFERPSASYAENHLCLNLSRLARLRYTPSDGHRPFAGPIPAGGGLICPAGMAVGWDLWTRARALSVRFTPEFLRSLVVAEGLDPARVALVYAAPFQDKRISALGKLLFDLLQSGGCPLTAGCVTRALATYLLERQATRPLGDPPLPPPPNDRRVRRAIDIIEASFTDAEFDVGAIAQQLGISSRQLSRLFEKTEYGSVWDYVIRRRVKLGCDLMLKQPTPSLVDVAGQAGFLDQSHFCRCFLKVMRMTPSKYRSRHR
jgi:AraC-like DNA-binding protein